MQVIKAVNLFLDYHKMKSQKITIRAYELFLAKFLEHFSPRDLSSITPEEILSLSLKSMMATGS